MMTNILSILTLEIQNIRRNIGGDGGHVGFDIMVAMGGIYIHV
jgi:hypothetical protein